MCLKGLESITSLFSTFYFKHRILTFQKTAATENSPRPLCSAGGRLANAWGMTVVRAGGKLGAPVHGPRRWSEPGNVLILELVRLLRKRKVLACSVWKCRILGYEVITVRFYKISNLPGLG